MVPHNCYILLGAPLQDLVWTGKYLNPQQCKAPSSPRCLQCGFNGSLSLSLSTPFFLRVLFFISSPIPPHPSPPQRIFFAETRGLRTTLAGRGNPTCGGWVLGRGLPYKTKEMTFPFKMARKKGQSRARTTCLESWCLTIQQRSLLFDFTRDTNL